MPELEETRRQIDELISHFDTAMLVTRDKAGSLRAVPLSVASYERDGHVWFFTSRTSKHAHQILETPNVAIILQSERRFVSISGRACLTQDRARMRALWRESWRPWFVNGPETGDATLLEVVPEGIEYWDLSGLKGLKYWFHAVGALIARKSASDQADKDFHGRVSLRDRA